MSLQIYSIDLSNSIRSRFEELIDNLSTEELNAIPHGFNNNIVWNYGHIIVSGYALAFISSGVDTSLTIPLYSKFRKGSRPEGIMTTGEINTLKELRAQFPAVLEEALKKEKFNNITAYATQTFGVPMPTLDSILTTIAAHDTFHYQTARMYKRILNSQQFINNQSITSFQ